MKKSKINSLFKISAITLVIFESSHLISLYFGLDKDQARVFFSASLIAFFFYSQYTVLIHKRQNESLAFYYPLLAFLAVFFVSMISSTFLFPKPAKDWVPSLYAFLPIFSFYFLYSIKATTEDLTKSLVIIAILVTVLLIADSLSRIELLDNYTRLSIFDKHHRRVVLLKNEVILGIIILASIMLSKKLNPLKFLVLFLILTACLVVQVKTMESRLGLAALIVAMITIVYFNRFQKKSLVFVMSACSIGLVLVPGWLINNIEIMQGATNLKDGGNISIRIETISFLIDIFYKSYGFGVGMMSPTGSINNILHSNPFINFYDGGVYASVAQFGIFGAYIWYKLTFGTIKKINGTAIAANTKNRHVAIAVVGFILGFTITPLPLNLFLQPWTTFIGGVVLYYLWTLSREDNPSQTPANKL
ncbi:hypothetical protein [Nitrincola sp.]|uniref:hypothetical protein n=1 Tax=Nitrincola sp. TaxID=1926584 RepID=UPI003A915161